MNHAKELAKFLSRRKKRNRHPDDSHIKSLRRLAEGFVAMIAISGVYIFTERDIIINPTSSWRIYAVYFMSAFLIFSLIYSCRTYMLIEFVNNNSENGTDQEIEDLAKPFAEQVSGDNAN